MATLYKAIYFDMDETIYPEKEFRLACLREVARWLGEKYGLNAADIISKINEVLDKEGQLYNKVLQDIIKIYRLDESLVNEALNVYRNYVPSLNPYPDFIETLNVLKKRFFLGVISDGLGFVQENKAKALNLSRWFAPEAIILTDKLQPPRDKRDPEVFAIAERIADASGKTCIYVGDNPCKDFRAARQRGWLTIRVCRGFYKDHADDEYICRSFGDLKQVAVYIKEISSCGKEM